MKLLYCNVVLFQFSSKSVVGFKRQSALGLLSKVSLKMTKEVVAEMSSITEIYQ
jgi:hypothetical protein